MNPHKGVPLRIAVIGTGWMGKNHVRVLSEMEGVTLAAVCDVVSPQALSKRYGCKDYTDYQQMIKNEALDAVIIAVPTNQHYSVAMSVMEAGLHVLVEKPIAATVKEGRELVSKAKECGVSFMVGHIERFNPAILELKRRLDAGELGKIFKIEAHRVGPFPERIRDVGVVRDLAVHDLDVMNFLVGSEPQRAYAETAQQIHTDHEDLLSGMIRFTSGTIGVLSINWLTPTKIRQLRITGEKGMFLVDYINQDLTFHKNAAIGSSYTYQEMLRGISEGDMIRYVIQKREPLRNELEHFVACINDKKRHLLASGEDGINAMSLAEALLSSSREGRVILFDADGR